MIGLSFGLTDLLSWPALVLSVVFLVTAAANLALSFPSSPGGIGPFELAAAASLLLVVGVDNRALAGSYALALHVVLLVPVTLLGLFYWWKENISLSRLSQRGEERAQTTSSGSGES